MPTTRTFLSLSLPSEVREAIAGLRRALPPPPRGLRWVRVEQAHLTLVFVGDADDAELEAIRRQARTTAAAATPFDADLRGLGAFPHPGRARVAWVGWGAAADRVVALQAALVAALDLPPERRPFSPHVTVARARDPLDLGAYLDAAPTFSSPTWRVDAVDVMASELRPSGAIHTLVERCPFADG